VEPKYEEHVREHFDVPETSDDNEGEDSITDNNTSAVPTPSTSGIIPVTTPVASTPASTPSSATESASDSRTTHTSSTPGGDSSDNSSTTSTALDSTTTDELDEVQSGSGSEDFDELDEVQSGSGSEGSDELDIRYNLGRIYLKDTYKLTPWLTESSYFDVPRSDIHSGKFELGPGSSGLSLLKTYGNREFVVGILVGCLADNFQRLVFINVGPVASAVRLMADFCD